MTQSQWILQALEHRPLTALEALEGCGCFRLAARIAELRFHNHKIITDMVTLPSGKSVARYSLEVPKLLIKQEDIQNER